MATTAGNDVKLKTMSEAELEPVLALLQGGDPDVIARRAGIARQRLLDIRDDLLAQVEQERAAAGAPAGRPQKKTGRNDPCPCGSGKKYKHCCLNRRPAPETAAQTAQGPAVPERAQEQAQLIHAIEGAFSLLYAGRLGRAQRRAEALLARYPNEDRLHDIRATALMYAGRHDAAVRICRARLAEAEREKDYFAHHGRYRDAGIDEPALSYYYPPLTWLQKTWIAQKAADYRAQAPPEPDEAICALVEELKTADDEARFPAKQAHGLELRRAALEGPLAALKAVGPEAIAYLLPVSVRYGWAGLFVPEILSACGTDAADRALIDISMFGFAYASGASLHYLEKRGDAAVSAIGAAFGRDREFDPIKTGIVSVLGSLRTPAAYDLLLFLLDHQGPHIVNWAGDALGRHENTDALAALIAARDRIGGERMIDQAVFHLKDLAGESQGGSAKGCSPRRRGGRREKQV